MDILIKLAYAAEILLGGLIFLQSYPRRSRFPLRLLLAAAADLITGYLSLNLRENGQLADFLGYQLTIGVIVLGMFLTFDGPFLAIMSSCIAGVAVQHIGHHLSRLLSLLPAVPPWNTGLELGCILSLYLILHCTMGQIIRRKRYYEFYDVRVSIVSMVIIFVCTGITRFLRLAGSLNAYTIVCTALYAITCCGLALFIQFFLYYFVRVNSEYLLLRRISEEERQQYEASRENAEQLSIQCHDLKHKLVALEGQLPKSEIDSMRSIIDTYDSTYHTGLDALDVALNEKNARCRKRKICLTYMGNGRELSFMDTIDVYSLFGNVIENAITAVDQISQPDKRAISLIVQRKGCFVYIDAVNFMTGSVPTFTDGLPETTKTAERGFHGYGLKSVRAIAQKYQGDVLISIDNGVFKVSVYMLDNRDSGMEAPSAS